MWGLHSSARTSCWNEWHHYKSPTIYLRFWCSHRFSSTFIFLLIQVLFSNSYLSKCKASMPVRFSLVGFFFQIICIADFSHRYLHSDGDLHTCVLTCPQLGYLFWNLYLLSLFLQLQQSLIVKEMPLKCTMHPRPLTTQKKRMPYFE